MNLPEAFRLLSRTFASRGVHSHDTREVKRYAGLSSHYEMLATVFENGHLEFLLFGRDLSTKNILASVYLSACEHLIQGGPHDPNVDVQFYRLGDLAEVALILQQNGVPHDVFNADLAAYIWSVKIKASVGAFLGLEKDIEREHAWLDKEAKPTVDPQPGAPGETRCAP